MKDQYTTGDISRICHVAPRTVSKWFDSGRLKGFLIPGSQDRRIPRKSLIEFIHQNELPRDYIDELYYRILAIGPIDNFTTLLDSSFLVKMALSKFEAGVVAITFHPDYIIDTHDNTIDVHAAVSLILLHAHEKEKIWTMPEIY
jgi:two-component system response regulator RpaA